MHMQPDSDIKLLFPTSVDWERWTQNRPFVPFLDEVVEFLNALSGSLLKDKESRSYPDVITFAFFCRRANLLLQKDKYYSNTIRLGRGIIFHIAPSNVPINFGYSLVAGLLSGNSNIVRLSSKDFPQVDLIVKHLYKLTAEGTHKEVIDRIALVKYDHTGDGTHFFSSFCNVRVIWGGDETIAQIRKSLIPARAFDVTFADRYSMAVIHASQLLKVAEPELIKLAEGFYNDTYLFDQNACSAPHLVCWLGDSENILVAQNLFWSSVQQIVKKKYEFQPVLAVDKLTAFYRQSINLSIEKISTKDNLLVRVNVKDIPLEIDLYRCAGGYFSEYKLSSLDEIAPIVTSKYQTMAYYGFEKIDLENFVLSNRLCGIDRIVPLGETTNFALTWDGYNLIDVLSRECSII